MSEITFKQFPLKPEILHALDDMGYSTPTPVQAASIPEVLKEKDLLVQAKTGSGKTLGFGLPLLNAIDPQKSGIQVLVMVPTRELAIQVAEELARAGAHLHILVSAVYGGVKLDTQLTDIAWSSILVGTPGRLRDHITRGSLTLTGCAKVVLDEADEMLDMGFKDDLEFILAALPKERQTLLYSATFPKPIEAIARKYMKNPEKISISSGLTTPTGITHRFVRVSEGNKIDGLIRLIEKEQPELGIIFCQRKSETAWIARKLKSAGLKVDFLNGDMNQAQRIATLDSFRNREINLLVATDVAARGLDITGISHVINASVPDNTETYVHRSGRTGRAGRTGIAITLVTPEEERNFARIQKDLAEAAAAQMPAPAKDRRGEPKPELRPERKPEPRPQPKAETKREPSAELQSRVRSESRAKTEPKPASLREPRFPLPDLMQANGHAEAYRELASQLLSESDPVEVVAALLSQRSDAQDYVKAKAKPERDPGRGRGNGPRARTSQTRKPSQLVYSDW